MPRSSRLASSGSSALLEVIKYPLFSEKVYRLIESNQYCFAVDVYATKPDIKSAVQNLFAVKVDSVATALPPPKKFGRALANGRKSAYKRAYVKLSPGNSISLITDS
mmetsp:Transcript_118429/g.209322  ORF Transcript_118429/g.209322 Transcript_118429/m.209322 type:complete len:107 (+) Transcript_118429:5-325(+)